MLKSFKTEINPTVEQKIKIRKTIGTCRFIYNFYLAHNKKLHEDGEKFMSSSKFRVWLNNKALLEDDTTNAATANDVASDKKFIDKNGNCTQGTLTRRSYGFAHDMGFGTDSEYFALRNIDEGAYKWSAVLLFY